jgi:hypothetical protein
LSWYAAPEGAEGEQVETRSFKIVEQIGSICFRRQLKEAGIVTRGSVLLGGVADDFEIGPAVDIRCSSLEIHPTGIVVRGTAAKAGDVDAVYIEAGKCHSQVSKKPVVRGSLSVRWPGAEAYPWTEFVASAQEGKIDSHEMHDTYRRFRRIVTSLRSHSKGSLARLKDKVEHRRILKNEIGKALLAQLLEDGIIALKKNFYHWVPDRAASLLTGC